MSFCDLYHTFQRCKPQPLPGPLRCPVQSPPCWAPVWWFPALFKYTEPEKKSSEVTGIWAKETHEKIYHPDRSSVLQDFKNRTQLVGHLQVKNCSLRIDPLHQSDTGPFHFRVEIKDYENYSYVHNTVSIDIKGFPEPPTLSMSEEVRVGELFTASCSVSHSCPTDPPVLTWSHSATPTVQSQQLSKGQWEVTSSLTFAPTIADHKKSLRCTAAYRGGKKAESSRTLNVKYGVLSSTKVDRHQSVIIATLQGSLGFADYTLCHANNSEGNTTQAFKLPKKGTVKEALL
ncbi:sialic acid-binding Ig-like lectin 14 [Osmerus mordax]|uniref:sialic acid-binding Ig-like lectin 14 n=1 Tax=Osmerus mordax TaxID=8014 RepID=UPI00350F3B24